MNHRQPKTPPGQQRWPHPRPAAFTLVELLIVVAVLALLASLLMPALRSALERSRRVVCLNNQKHCHTGAVAFAEDHNDLLPPGNSTHLCLYANCGKNTWGPRYAGSGTPCDYGEAFVREYLGVSYPASGGFADMKNILYCPDGRLDRTRPGAASPLWKSASFCGTNAIDYQLAGTSLYGNQNVYYAFARLTRMWAWQPVRNNVTYRLFFSRDCGGAYSSPGEELYLPHQAGNDVRGVKTVPAGFALASYRGLNLMDLDGSGRWIPVEACTVMNRYFPGTDQVSVTLFPRGYVAPLYPGYPPAATTTTDIGSARNTSDSIAYTYADAAGGYGNGGIAPEPTPGMLGYTFSDK